MTSKKVLLVINFICFIICSCAEKKEKDIQITTILETTKSWNGTLLPKFSSAQPKVTISKVVIPPKAKLPRHLHPVITTGMLTKGELTVTDDNNKQITIKAGDVLVEVTNTIHFGENTGNVPAEIIVFYIGPEDSPTTVIEKKH
ncbi:cupin domain-containing protein [Flavobacteriaceae bacterium S356]|uniref:Cupin domain-containing protein n=1 Tax=Asprobacillus argus TaxID=3076534 RepID=A0ABU3LHK6_9FLAO|nr:cupin domain-containing protein [Flavobacteriaceae bacterium S356]